MILHRMLGHVVRKASMPWLLVKKTPGQNEWSRDEEGKHAMATGQELTPGTMHGHVVRKASMPWLLVKN